MKNFNELRSAMSPKSKARAATRARRLVKKIKVAKHTPGPWRVWEGPAYVGGGEDLCIGAGDTWLANMDHRSCQNYAHHIGCHDEGCKLEANADVCSLESCVTAEQRANANLIAAAPDLLAACRAFVKRSYANGEFLMRVAEREAAEAAIAKADGR